MLQSVRRILRFAPAAFLLVALPLSVVGCKQKTPEERFEEARALVVEQRQIPLGVLKLKELLKEAPDDPTAIDARFMLAEIYMSLGRKENMQNAFKELEVIYTKLGLTDPRGVQAHQFATQVLFQQEEVEQAIAHAKDGEELAEDPEAKLQMGFLLSQIRLMGGTEEDKKLAEEFFKTVALENEDPMYRGQAREMIADHFRRAERFEDSNTVYAAHLEKFPDDEVNPQIILAQALNYRLAKNEEKFEELFKLGSDKLLEQINTELNPETKVRMQRDSARLFEVAGKLDRSEEMLRQIMAENVGKAPGMEAQMGIGELYLRTAQFDKAEELFESIRRDNPNSPFSQAADQALEAITQYRAQLAAKDADTTGTVTQEAQAPATEE